MSSKLDWFTLNAMRRAVMQYDAENYDPRDLKLVYMHCGVLYNNFMHRERPSCLQCAIDDCKHYLSIKSQFETSLEEREFSRLMNELSYIRLELGF